MKLQNEYGKNVNKLRDLEVLGDLTDSLARPITFKYKISMKVFGCKRQSSYSGGIVLVAANNVEEAFRTAAFNDKIDYLFDSIDSEGYYIDKNDPNAIIESETYPIEKWEEYTHLTCDFTEPQVILEAGYSE